MPNNLWSQTVWGVNKNLGQPSQVGSETFGYKFVGGQKNVGVKKNWVNKLKGSEYWVAKQLRGSRIIGVRLFVVL